LGTAVRPAKMSPGLRDAFADVDVFVDEVRTELAAMARNGIRGKHAAIAAIDSDWHPIPILIQRHDAVARAPPRPPSKQGAPSVVLFIHPLGPGEVGRLPQNRLQSEIQPSRAGGFRAASVTQKRPLRNHARLHHRVERRTEMDQPRSPEITIPAQPFVTRLAADLEQQHRRLIGSSARRQAAIKHRRWSITLSTCQAMIRSSKTELECYQRTRSVPRRTPFSDEGPSRRCLRPSPIQ
jgi:hypothetical protein